MLPDRIFFSNLLESSNSNNTRRMRNICIASANARNTNCSSAFCVDSGRGRLCPCEPNTRPAREIAISLAANLTRDIYLSHVQRNKSIFPVSVPFDILFYFFFIFTFCFCFVFLLSFQAKGTKGTWEHLCCCQCLGKIMLFIYLSVLYPLWSALTGYTTTATRRIVIYEMSKGAVASGRRTMYVYNWFGCVFPGPPLSPFFLPISSLSLLFPSGSAHSQRNREISY